MLDLGADILHQAAAARDFRGVEAVAVGVLLDRVHAGDQVGEVGAQVLQVRLEVRAGFRELGGGGGGGVGADAEVGGEEGSGGFEGGEDVAGGNC